MGVNKRPKVTQFLYSLYSCTTVAQLYICTTVLVQTRTQIQISLACHFHPLTHINVCRAKYTVGAQEMLTFFLTLF